MGGFVRDLLLGRAAPDVDLVVEGDGIAFARRLGEEIGGTVLVHGSFGTASIEGGRAPAGAGVDGAPLGRESRDRDGHTDENHPHTRECRDGARLAHLASQERMLLRIAKKDRADALAHALHDKLQ